MWRSTPLAADLHQCQMTRAFVFMTTSSSGSCCSCTLGHSFVYLETCAMLLASCSLGAAQASPAACLNCCSAKSLHLYGKPFCNRIFCSITFDVRYGKVAKLQSNLRGCIACQLLKVKVHISCYQKGQNTIPTCVVVVILPRMRACRCHEQEFWSLLYPFFFFHDQLEAV